MKARARTHVDFCRWRAYRGKTFSDQMYCGNIRRKTYEANNCYREIDASKIDPRESLCIIAMRTIIYLEIKVFPLGIG
ncbi:hypothetical protein [Paraburkholderia antibiotica]|uniref:Uncharacterized protein n=1 Tax=Paraburkholderia antibiotica TaxID=2728839 RepID=A0A7X9X250_9BURK|nr:hypothetical protein [Paraburkholderia antibiotica]NML30032.1 hypothetical protein [Paraburkholderia antibiotica]